jgi:hypothetical protein
MKPAVRNIAIACVGALAGAAMLATTAAAGGLGSQDAATAGLRAHATGDAMDAYAKGPRAKARGARRYFRGGSFLGFGFGPGDPWDYAFRSPSYWYLLKW